MKKIQLIGIALKSLVAATLIAGTLPAMAQTQGTDRRDDRRDTRQDARDTKQDCKAGDEKTRADCRQDKRDTKQDARKN